jgi:hypothetical protein
MHRVCSSAPPRAHTSLRPHALSFFFLTIGTFPHTLTCTLRSPVTSPSPWTWLSRL